MGLEHIEQLYEPHTSHACVQTNLASSHMDHSTLALVRKRVQVLGNKLALELVHSMDLVHTHFHHDTC